MSKGRRMRARRSASEWRTIMTRFERSGQTGTQFCRSESLPPSTFWRWRGRLADAGESVSPSRPAGRAAFVELADAPASPSIWEAELELGGGVVLRLRRC